MHYLRGGAQWKADDLAGASGSFRRAIDLKPDFVDARVALASVALAAGDDAEAQQTARALQADYPERDLGYRIEGMVMLEAGKPAEAVAPLKKALALQPNAQIARQLADAYVRSGKQGEAISMLEQWIAETPDDLGSQAFLAILLHGEGMPERALPIYERLYSAGETNLLVLNNLAWLLHERGDPRALDIAGKAYELNPNRPEVADTFGWILFNSGERDRGLSILQQAHLAYPTQTEIAYHTAVALDGMGRGNEAVSILRRLLREHPNSDQAADAQLLFNKLTGSGAG